MTSAMHNALRNASLTTRERVLRDIGRKLEPDPIALKPGLVTQMTALSGFPPLKIIRSPEQPRLSERISKIEVRDRKRKMAAIAAAASVIILAVSGCKQANLVRSDVCFVPREPAIEDARGITDGTNEKPVDVTERVVFVCSLTISILLCRTFRIQKETDKNII